MNELTSAQISEWVAYDKLDPIGTWRDDFRFAQMQAFISNIMNAMYHKEGEEPTIVQPIEYMPVWNEEDRVEKEPEVQSVDDMLSTMLGIAKRQNAKVAYKRTTPPINKDTK